ncbi:hypothetical protein QCA50_014705 [Cerrena zonata]|uniref:DUF6589 domain-containing protein n=1 Tax=Cerrena zonata TaxID=2478898 RepID=A0AAW0FV28_9APHY
MPLSLEQAAHLLTLLESAGSTLAEFVIIVLQHQPFGVHNAIVSLPAHATTLLNTLVEHQLCRKEIEEWTYEHVVVRLKGQITELTRKSSGWHFGASTARIEKLDAFDLATMAQEMRAIAPQACDLISRLLAANEEANKAREARKLMRIAKHKENQKLTRRRRTETRDGNESDTSNSSDVLWAEVDGMDGTIVGEDHITGDDADDGSDSDDLWAQVDGVGGREDEDEDMRVNDVWARADGIEGNEDRASHVRERVLLIRLVTCLSIFMQSTNQHCNALQSVVGIFLHTCHVSQAAMDLLARMGCSISASSVNNAITSLSKESVTVIQQVGQTLLASAVYDNVDADIHRLVPTAEKPHNTLIHLTAGMLVPLQHDVTLEDLNCSQELWERLQNNSSATIDMHKLRSIHTETAHPSGLLRRQRFNAWMILNTLVHHGPEWFRRYQCDLGEPEAIEQIPISKSRHIPVRTMDINPSTISGNADVFGDMFKQAGIGDPTEEGQEHVTAVGNTVILVHGDLGTGEHIESLKRARSLERTPLRRLQMVVYVPGLFHLKMACADALWRIFIEPKQSHEDPNSLFSHIGKLRPKETLKFASGPGFRRMHKAIQHIGIVSRLDIWREKVGHLPDKFPSLEAFAESKPSWAVLTALANDLARDQVTGSNLHKLRQHPRGERDLEHENMLLRQRFFLLYEEITYAMNVGDIGRVEACFMPWVYIFRGCGKHKYAAFMMRYLHNVHFIYPPGLKRAVRMNILCNPTGQPKKCRAHDWVQEHHNLFTKTINGGDSSNYQKEHIIKESPLLEIYRNIQEQLQDMFESNQKGNLHSSPNMERTFQVLARYMEKTKASSVVPGRSAHYVVPDVMLEGMHILMTTNVESADVDQDTGDNEDESADKELEVEDRDDLLVE